MKTINMMTTNWYEIDTRNIPYDDIDKELRDLIYILNTFDSIKTFSCCCGHGKTPCEIYLAVKDLSTIRNFCFNYLNPFYGWHFEIENNINKDQDYLILCLKSKSINYDDVCKEINELYNKIFIHRLQRQLISKDINKISDIQYKCPNCNSDKIGYFSNLCNYFDVKFKNAKPEYEETFICHNCNKHGYFDELLKEERNKQ